MDRRRVDSKLVPFLDSQKESEAGAILARIVADTIEPVLKQVVRRRLGVFLNGSLERAPERDAQDLCSEITLNILVKLRELKSGALEEGIENLAGFVANVAHQRCSDYFRQKHPERWRLKTRVRYMLSHYDEFCIRQNSSGEWICGLARKEQREGLLTSMEAEAILQDSQLHRASTAEDLKATLTAILESARKPVELDMLVMICAKLSGIQDEFPTEADVHEFPSLQQNALDRIVGREYLHRLWLEIGDLPEKQRQALLLSLRDTDGHSVLPLLPTSGVASIEDIASSLKVSLKDIAALWNRIPLEDLVIAERLGITRQQVINLRKSARERLSRRMSRQKQ